MTDKQPEALIRADELEAIGAESSLARAMAAHTIRLLYKEKAELVEVLQQALDALIDAADSQSWEMQQNIDQHGEWYRRSLYLKQSTTNSQKVIEALRARLTQPEPEPVAWMHIQGNHEEPNWRKLNEDEISRGWMQKPLYAAPPQREWQDLPGEEEDARWDECLGVFDCLKMTQAKLKEKNG